MNEENKITKGDVIKDIIMGISLIIIGIGCFFTYNPSEAGLEIGTDGMTFATYPLGIAVLLLFLSIIYLFNSLRKYALITQRKNERINFVENILENKQLYFYELLEHLHLPARLLMDFLWQKKERQV